jgi:hypothetical protein
MAVTANKSQSASRMEYDRLERRGEYLLSLFIARPPEVG